jgi:integral membrane protein
MIFGFSKTPIGTLRLAGFIEGWSYIILLFVAMPLKYFGDMPMAVKYVGWAHGLLFIWYVLSLLKAMQTQRWNMIKAFTVFVISLIPFGTFAYDKVLKREEQSAGA